MAILLGNTSKVYIHNQQDSLTSYSVKSSLEQHPMKFMENTRSTMKIRTSEEQI